MAFSVPKVPLNPNQPWAIVLSQSEEDHWLFVCLFVNVSDKVVQLAVIFWMEIFASFVKHSKPLSVWNILSDTSLLLLKVVVCLFISDTIYNVMHFFNVYIEQV